MAALLKGIRGHSDTSGSSPGGTENALTTPWCSAPDPPPSAAMHNRPQGFSLVELILVLLITSVILSITMPTLVFVQGQLEARGASRRFAAAHSLTRSTAIRHAGIASLRIDPYLHQFWIQVDTGAASDTVSFHDGFPSGMTMSSNRNRVCFDSRGLSTTRAGCEPGDVQVSFEVAGHTEVIQSTVLGRLLR